MPRYGFHCSQCGVEFEVSRPMSQAGDPASCPHDGAPGTRIFHVPTTISSGGSSAPTPPSGGGHGHDHAPGADGPSH